MSVALTVMKAWPFHVGHEFLIKSAMAIADTTVVLVMDSYVRDTYGYTRLDAVIDIQRRFVKDIKERRLILLTGVDESPETEYDENGTALSEEFWNYWVDMAKNQTYGIGLDYIVTSDLYGKEWARRLGVKWIPIDPDRAIYPISGTEIRASTLEYWDYLADTTKQHLQKKIAVVGPESSGKSTLVKKLTDYYGDFSGITEYGRTLSVALRHDMTIEDFEIIFKMQKSMIDTVANQTLKPVIVTDTEAFTTYQFMEVYNVGTPKERWDMYEKYVAPQMGYFDHFVLLPPILKWDDDGERKVSSYKERKKMYDGMFDYVKRTKTPYTILSDPNKDAYDRADDVYKIGKEMIVNEFKQQD